MTKIKGEMTAFITEVKQSLHKYNLIYFFMLEHAIKRGNINAQPVSVVFTLWMIKKMFGVK